MLKKIQIILIILFSFFLVSCGYKKVIQNDAPVIYIKKFDYSGNKRLGYIIKNQVLLASQDGAKNTLEIQLNLEKNKFSKNKNKSGKITRFTVQLEADISIKNLENMEIINRSFNQTGDYQVQDNHFETINTEKNVTSNLVEKISEEIVTYLMLSYRN